VAVFWILGRLLNTELDVAYSLSRRCLSLMHSFSVTSANIAISDIAKNHIGLIFVADIIHVQSGPKSKLLYL